MKNVLTGLFLLILATACSGGGAADNNTRSF